MDTKPAIIYTRFSPRPNEKECQSIARQVDRCRAKAKEYGYSVIAEFEDRAKTGATMDGRPGLSDALNMVVRYRATLFVYSLARLSRSIRDVLEIIETLRKRKCELFILNPEIKIDRGIQGKMYIMMMSMFAEFEREIISERIKDAQLYHLSQGKRVTRFAPYGYALSAKDPGRFVKDAYEQQVIKRIIELYNAEPRGPHQIASALAAENWKPRGKSWSHVTIGKLLQEHCDYRPRPRRLSLDLSGSVRGGSSHRPKGR